MPDAQGLYVLPLCTMTKTKEYGDATSGTYIETCTYSDGIGRKIQEKKEAEDGNWRTIDYYYNSSGRNYKTSVPYFTTSYEYVTGRDDTKYYTGRK